MSSFSNATHPHVQSLLAMEWGSFLVDCRCGTQARIAEPGAVATGSWAQLSKVDFVTKDTRQHKRWVPHPVATAPGPADSLLSLSFSQCGGSCS